MKKSYAYFWTALLFSALSLQLQAAEFPRYFLLSKDRVDELQQLGLAERTFSTGGRFSVSYVRLLASEGGKATTRDETTTLQFVHITYNPILSGNGYVPTSLRVTSANLDWEGKLDAVGVAYTKEYASEKAKAVPARKFYNSLPEWAKKQLHICSGFLSENPGQAVADYDLNEDERAAKFISEVINWSPLGAGLKYIGKNLGSLLETTTKNVSSSVILNLAKENEVRWGASHSLSKSRLGSNTSHFEKIGKTMWNF